MTTYPLLVVCLYLCSINIQSVEGQEKMKKIFRVKREVCSSFDSDTYPDVRDIPNLHMRNDEESDVYSIGYWYTESACVQRCASDLPKCESVVWFEKKGKCEMARTSYIQSPSHYKKKGNANYHYNVICTDEPANMIMPDPTTTATTLPPTTALNKAVCISFDSDTYPDVRNIPNLHMRNDERVDVYSAVKDVYAESVCVQLCANDLPTCKSVVWFEKKDRCELSTTTYTESPDSYERKSGATYHYNVICLDGPVTTTTLPATNALPPSTPMTSSFQCGDGANPGGTSKIIGGYETDPHAWPWQVTLETFSGFQYCGGSLVRVSSNHESTDVIITAAHCVTGSNPLSVYIGVGEHDLTDNLPSIRASSILVHPQYDSYWLNNDIAIVVLSSPVAFNSVIRPVCIPSTSDRVPAGTNCYITGWGNINNQGSAEYPDVLQEVNVPIVSDSTCANIYPSHWITPFADEMLCAGDVDTTDSCQGDSGGPLVCTYPAGSRYYLHGVTSWGVGCAQGYPGVYAEVANYCSWLESSIARLSSIGDITTYNLC